MRKGFAVNLNDRLKVNNSPASFLFSSRCFLCSSHSRDHERICSACLEDMALNTNACPACAKPNAASRLCVDCLNRSQAHIDNSWALFQYHYPVNRLIQNIKFQQGIGVAHSLGEMLSKLFPIKSATLPDCIMPVPLHSSRLISRGYNQSVEIARPLSKQLGVKLDSCSCKRIRATTPQADLPANKRKQNVRNAFSLSKKVDYNHILLVDDVITTGSTINELARILGLAGVGQIDVMAIARAG